MKNMQKGFTIIEVTIAAAVSTIIIFGAFGILQVSNKQLEIIHAKMTLQEGMREALFKMAQEIRQAPQKVDGNRINLTEVDILTTNDTPNVIPNAQGIENASTIVFQIPDASSPAVDDNYEPKWVRTIQYRQSNPAIQGEIDHQLLRIDKDPITGGKKQAILANDVTALAFSRKTVTPTLVTITLSGQKVLSDGKKIPIQMTAQAEARNP